MLQGALFEPPPAPCDDCTSLQDERSLLAVAMALGARDVRGWSAAEAAVAGRWTQAPRRLVTGVRERILAGEDPLGDAFCTLHSATERRQRGATFTPQAIVDAMVDWSAGNGRPARIVDPGTGSARYLVSAGRRFPDAVLLGIEDDPLPAILARANLAAAGLADRAEIVVGDYRSATVGRIDGQTLFIGNPPYVRHHRIARQWKAWLTAEAAKNGLCASQLAGLHVHFFLATVAKAAIGDFGAFITAAEWLDVNYGSLPRDLFVGPLGGQRIDIIAPTLMPFPDATTTAAITYFQIGSRPRAVRFKHVERIAALRDPSGARMVDRRQLASERRWSHLTRAQRKGPLGYIELGELCRVHRGQVTGANKVWIAGPHCAWLPESVLFPTVTKARELFRAGGALEDAAALRRVVDLPIHLETLSARDRRLVDRFLESAMDLGAHLGYVASNRKAWWSVGLREPAPILATYMARRPPAFVHNRAGARHINIAHGIYPREPLDQVILESLVAYLSRAVNVSAGRTYAGGLTKFEPREMERLLIPAPEMLKLSGP